MMTGEVPLEHIRICYDRLYLKLVRRLLFRFGTPEIVLEAVQEAFVKAILQWKNLKDKDDLEAWLYRVAVNNAIDEIRNQARYDGFAKTNQQATWEPTPETEAILGEQKEVLRSAIQSLKPIFREVLFFFYKEEFTIEEIADHLDIPIGTVKSRLHRAKQYLRHNKSVVRVVSGMEVDISNESH